MNRKNGNEFAEFAPEFSFHGLVNHPSNEHVFEMISLPKDIVTDITSRLVNGLHPRRIYLFGSRARDGAHPASDLDICLVMENESAQTQLEVARKARRLLFHLPWAVDVIVRTEREFEDRAAWDTTLEASIERTGTLIHD